MLCMKHFFKPIYLIEAVLITWYCSIILFIGRLLPPSHDVYALIAKLMLDEGSSITPKHIHTIINNNRNGVKDFVLKHLAIKEANSTRSEDGENYTINSQPTINSSSSSASLNVVISAEKWKRIRPMEKLYGNRVYWKLRVG